MANRSPLKGYREKLMMEKNEFCAMLELTVEELSALESGALEFIPKKAKELLVELGESETIFQINQTQFFQEVGKRRVRV